MSCSILKMKIRLKADHEGPSGWVLADMVAAWEKGQHISLRTEGIDV